MAIVFNSFSQPNGPGDVVGVDLVGDPVLNPTEVVRFIKFGEYRVLGDHSGDAGSPFRRYDLQLLAKYSSSPVPAGTVAQLEKEGVSHSPLAYDSVTYLSFKEDDFRSLSLSGNIMFAAQHHSPAKTIKLRIRNVTGNLYTVTVPISWTRIANFLNPHDIQPNELLELTVTSYGRSDADIVVELKSSNS